ncbi:hypothetical protein O181_031636 [Austropuccinia psidii MF-1]|uniref:Transketolase-like pyrimidine-binding domain-containing protein n=1 Tax=Austropuccinia psidii MF-1 TaxID=1389203 RepID=A0A9Q3H5D7_9BASI|nr:hypothetical protein [Austropuccinia psidii MF-1]
MAFLHRLRSNARHRQAHPLIRGFHQSKVFATADQPVWGYQRPQSFQLPDFTPQQLLNRASQASLVRLVESYRRHAHRSATLDPLSLTPRPPVPALDPRRYGFGVSSNFIQQVLPPNHIAENLPAEMIQELGDEHKLWAVDGVVGMGTSTQGEPCRTLAQIMGRLEEVYCGRIAYEYMHLPNKSEREWLSETLESKVHDMAISDQSKIRYWQLLHRSEAFDQFLAAKFPNVKRYGLEGGESMLVALDRIFEECGTHGIEEVVVAMPHRGRLNFLTQLLSLDLDILIQKLKGKSELPRELLLRTPAYTGDVLSHLTTSTALKRQDCSAAQAVNVHVLPNPSHLEAVSPVGLGLVRAINMLNRIGPYSDHSSTNGARMGDKFLSVQIHGDAAFGGQGVVAETLNLSTLPHFTVGGSVRLVLNNQLGYTTPATEGRTSFYATDIGKSIGAPIIHVNGEYPEDVSRALALAFAFRNQFRKDVLVDLVVYRRWGHNELDEPTYTSPHMYQKINSLLSVPNRYEKELLETQVIKQEQVDQFKLSVNHELESALKFFENPSDTQTGSLSKTGLMNLHSGFDKRCSSSRPSSSMEDNNTGVELTRLQAAARASVSIPKDFNIHPRLQKMHIQKRLQAIEGKQGDKITEIDFSTAEASAFGTLLEDGYDIRLSGQDSGRGTFSQRHALLTDQIIEGRTIVPLNQLAHEDPTRGKLEIVNSPLSEYSVLGFEVGFSYLTSRACLTLWEAQFGDFVNTAQVTVDQFIASGQFKWPTFDSGLVLLLPHGLDGAGPEHSSCRIERFLMSANEPWSYEARESQIGIQGANISVCNATTPAQYFHLLRRQMKMGKNQRPKPLIICTPKTLLRARETFSSLVEMGPGTAWKEVIDDPLFEDHPDKASIERLVLCSGKVYYDLIKKRKALGMDSKVGLVRIEELTPFPYRTLHQVIRTYRKLNSVIWAQEEPENSGALYFVINRIGQVLRKLNNQNAFANTNETKENLPFHDVIKKPELGFIARPSCASPATGIGEIFKMEKAIIENEVFNLKPDVKKTPIKY